MPNLLFYSFLLVFNEHEGLSVLMLTISMCVTSFNSDKIKESEDVS